MQLAQAMEAEKDEQLQLEAASRTKLLFELSQLTDEVKTLQAKNQELEGRLDGTLDANKALRRKDVEIEALKQQLLQMEQDLRESLQEPSVSSATPLPTPKRGTTPRASFSGAPDTIFAELTKWKTMAQAQADALQAEQSALEMRLVKKESEYAKVRAKLLEYEQGVDGLLEANKQLEQLEQQLEFRADELARLKQQVNQEKFAAAGLMDWLEGVRALAMQRGCSAKELEALRPAEVKPLTVQDLTRELQQREEEVGRAHEEVGHWKRRAMRQLGGFEGLAMTPLQLEWLHEYIDLVKAGDMGPPKPPARAQVAVQTERSDRTQEAQATPCVQTRETGVTPRPQAESATDPILKQDASTSDAPLPAEPGRTGPSTLIPTVQGSTRSDSQATPPRVAEVQAAASEAQAAALAEVQEEVRRLTEEARRWREEADVQKAAFETVQGQYNDLSQLLATDIKQVVKDVMGNTFAHGVTYSLPATVNAEGAVQAALQLVPAEEATEGTAAAHMPLQVASSGPATAASAAQTIAGSPHSTRAAAGVSLETRSHFSAVMLRLLAALEQAPVGAAAGPDPAQFEALVAANAGITQALDSIQAELQASNEARRAMEARIAQAEGERDRYRAKAAQRTAAVQAAAQARGALEDAELATRAEMLGDELLAQEQRSEGLQSELNQCQAQCGRLQADLEQAKQALLEEKEAGLRIKESRDVLQQEVEGLRQTQNEAQMDRDLRAAEAEEYKRFVVGWSEMDQETVERKVMDCIRRITALRINEVTQARQYKLLETRRASMLKELCDVKQSAMETEAALRDKCVRLEENEQQLLFDLEGAKKLVEKAARDWKQSRDTQQHVLTEKIRVLQEQQVGLAVDGYEWTRTKESCRRLEKKVEEGAIEVEALKAKVQLSERLVEELKRNSQSSDLADLRSRLITLEVEHEEAVQKAFLYERRMKAAEAEQQDLEDRVRLAKQEVIEIRKQLMKALEDKGHAVHQLEGTLAKQEAEALTKKVEQLEKEVQRHQLESERHRQIAETATHQCINVQTFKDQMTAEIQGLHETITAMQTKDDEGLLLGKLHNTLLDFKLQNLQFKKKVGKMEVDFRRMQAESKVFGLRMRVQSNEMGRLYADYIHASYHTTSQNRRLRLEVKGCSTLAKTQAMAQQLQKMQSAQAATEAEMADAKERLDQMMESNQLLTVEKQQLQQQLAAHRLEPSAGTKDQVEKIAALNQQITALKLSDVRLNRQLSALKDKEQFLLKSQRDAEATIHELDESKAELELQLQNADDLYAAKAAELHRRIVEKEQQATEMLKTTAENTRSLEEKSAAGGDMAHHHVAKIQELTDTVTRHMKLIGTLRGQNSDQESKLETLKHELQKKEDLIYTLRKEISSERENSRIQNDRVKDVEGRRHQQAAQVAQQNLSTLQRLLKQKEAALVRAQEMLHRERSKHLADKQLDTCRIQTLHDRLYRENEEMISRFQATLHTITSAPAVTPAAAYAEGVQMQEEVQVLRSTADTLTQQLAAQGVELQNALRERDATAATLSNAESAVQSLEAQVQSLEAQVESLESEARSLKAQVQGLQRSMADAVPRPAAGSDAAAAEPRAPAAELSGTPSRTLVQAQTQTDAAPEPALALAAASAPTRPVAMAPAEPPVGSGPDAAIGAGGTEGKGPHVSFGALDMQNAALADHWQREAERLKSLAGDRHTRITQLEAQVQRLIMQITQYSVQAAQPPTGMVTTEEVNQLLFDRNTAVRELTAQVAILEEYNAKLVSQMEALVMRDRDLESEIRAKATETQTLGSEVEAQQEKLLHKTAEAAQLVTSNRMMKKQLEEKDKQNLKLQQALVALRAKLVSKAEVDLAQRVIHETDHMTTEHLLQQQSNAHQQLKVLQVRLERMKEDTEARAQRERSLTSEVRALKDTVQRYQTLLASQDADIKKFARQTQRSTDASITADQKCAQLEKQLQQLQQLCEQQADQLVRSQREVVRKDKALRARQTGTRGESVPIKGDAVSAKRKPVAPSTALQHPGPDAGLQHPGPDAGLQHPGPDAGLQQPGPSARPQCQPPQPLRSSQGSDLLQYGSGIDAEDLPLASLARDPVLSPARAQLRPSETKHSQADAPAASPPASESGGEEGPEGGSGDGGFAPPELPPPPREKFDMFGLRQQLTLLQEKNVQLLHERDVLRRAKMEWEVVQAAMKRDLESFGEEAVAKGQILREQLEWTQRQREEGLEKMQEELDQLRREKLEWGLMQGTMRRELAKLESLAETKRLQMQQELDRLRAVRPQEDLEQEQKRESLAAEKEVKIKQLQRDLKYAREDSQREKETWQKERAQLQKALKAARIEAETSKSEMAEMIVKHRSEMEAAFDRKAQRELKDIRMREQNAKREQQEQQRRQKEERERREFEAQQLGQKEKREAERLMRREQQELDAMARTMERTVKKAEATRESTETAAKLRDKVKALTARSEERAKALEQAQKEAGDLREEVEEKSQSLAKAEQKLRLLEAEKTIPKDQKPTAQTLKQFKETIMRLEDENDALQRVIQVDKELELNNWKAALQRTQQELHGLETTVAELQRQVHSDGIGVDSDAQKEAQRLRRRVQELEDELLAERNLVHQFRFEKENVMLQITRHKRHTQDLLEALAEAEPEVAAPAAPAAPPKDRTKDREKDLKLVIDSLKKVVSQQQVEMEHMRQNAVSNVKHVELLKELKMLRAKAKEHQSTVQKLQKPTAEDEKKAQTLLAENAALRVQLKKEKEALQQSRAQYTELQHAHSRALAAAGPGQAPAVGPAAAVDAAETSGASVHLAAGDAPGAADAKDDVAAQQVVALTELVEAHKQTINRAEAEQQVLQRDNQQLHQEVDGLRGRVSDTEASLQRKAEEMAQLQALSQRQREELRLAEAECDKLRIVNQQLADEMGMFNDDFFDEIEQLKHRSQELQARNHHLERRNAELEARILEGSRTPTPSTSVSGSSAALRTATPTSTAAAHGAPLRPPPPPALTASRIEGMASRNWAEARASLCTDTSLDSLVSSMSDSSDYDSPDEPQRHRAPMVAPFGETSTSSSTSSL